MNSTLVLLLMLVAVIIVTLLVFNADKSERSDPLSEADIYIRYGMINKAAEVLKEAIRNNPDDPALRNKLKKVEHI